jgi:uncharacterized protein (TIGR00251 family)
MSIISETDNGIIINIRLIPRASANKITGILDNAIKIRLQAPPVDGKANKALIKFLSKLFKIPASHITLISGETNRNKRILINGIKKVFVKETLTQYGINLNAI